jgi:quercetin dioxygenase-like cupin family protein
MKRRNATAARGAFLATAALLLTATSSTADMPYHGEGQIMLTPSEMVWGPIASMAEPAQIFVVEGDLKAAVPFTFRLKLPAGYEVLPHVHPAYERVTVISGTFHFAHGEVFDRAATTELPAGSVAIMAPGDPMFGYASEDTVIQVHGTGPWGIKYLRPEDDPRS